MKHEGKFILMTREECKTYIEGITNIKKFTTIQQHHTASPAYKDVKSNNHISLMKSMENYHVNNLKMTEIAQHFSTFPDGLICVGRPLNKDGGGFLSPKNKDSITVENVGNFDSDLMTKEQKESIIFLNALLCIKCNIVPSVDTLIYHCWIQNKSCPGTKWFGGNSKAAAGKNFIPLVTSTIAIEIKLKTAEQAIAWLVSKGALNSPDYWLSMIKEVKYLDSLLINITNKWKG